MARPATPVSTAVQFLAFLDKKQIKGLVIDMDRTMVSEHSGGYLEKREVKKFVECLTPASRELILKALESKLQLCIATYSDELYKGNNKEAVAGRELVLEILKSFLKDDDIKKITIFSLNPDLYRKSALGDQLAAAHFTARAAGKPAGDRGDAKAVDASIPATQNFFNEKIDAVIAKKENIDKDVLAKLRQFPPLPFKDHHLYVFSALSGIALGEMCLIDDSKDNVDNAKKLGVLGVHVSGTGGLLARHLDDAVRADTARRA